MGQGSSRREEPSRSVETPKSSGRLTVPARSVLTPPGSSRREIYSRGGQVVFEPTIIAGPTETPLLTSAHIYFTTDIPAYGRVRYRTSGGELVVTDWEGPTTDADIYLSPLLPEHETYFYDIEASSDEAHEHTTGWLEGDQSDTFATLCSGVYGIDNVLIRKLGSGKLTYLRVDWTTSVVCGGMQTDGNVSTLDYGPASSSSGQAHYHNYMDFEFREGSYWIKIKMRNSCYQWSSYTAPYNFSVDGGGDVQQV